MRLDLPELSPTHPGAAQLTALLQLAPTASWHRPPTSHEPTVHAEKQPLDTSHLALKYGIHTRIECCEKLFAASRISAGLGRDLSLALTVFQWLRLDTQSTVLDAGRAPDNVIHTERLRRLDCELLRDTLHVVKGFRQQIKIESI